MAAAPTPPAATLICGVLWRQWALLLLLGGKKHVLLLHLRHLLLERMVVGGEVG
jgi:hypothetical protein